MKNIFIFLIFSLFLGRARFSRLSVISERSEQTPRGVLCSPVLIRATRSRSSRGSRTCGTTSQAPLTTSAR